jgi:diguanylate cyclase (GGDEF)-like protein
MRHYNEESEQQLSFTGIAQDGSHFKGNMRFAPASFDGEACTQVIVKRAETRSQEPTTVDANTDPVTHLYNRYFFVDALSEHLEKLDEEKSSLLYIGINEPTALKKRIGLSGSHAVRHGIAELMKEHFDSQLGSTIAHYGEDSFTVLLQGIGSAQAEEISASLCQRIEDQIFEVDKMSAQCTCSVGIIDFTKARFNSAYQVMDAAFSVLEEARLMHDVSGGETGIVVFHPKEDGDIEIGFHLGDLIDEKRLRMVYQPIIHLHGERLERYDATLRLLDCEGKEQAIDQLIQSVNQKVGDTELDRWLVTEATESLRNLRATGQDAQITINLTQNALLDSDFPNWIQQHCLNIRLDPKLLTLQLQETIIEHHLSQAMVFFEQIRRLGAKSAVSHFGNTQDSFKVLKRLNVDYVMTDGSFTLALQKDPSNADRLKRTLTQLKEHKVATVVPFVENAATLASLWQMNVHYIQGHYLQAPSETMDYEFADMV